jgi:erythromycin esterase-like protein
MADRCGSHSTLDEWIAREAISFDLESAESFDAAVDRMMGSMGRGVHLLGLGEALHGGEEFLVLRNRLFQRLVEAHGFTAVAVESSFPRGRVVDAYVNGTGATSFDDVREVGFSHTFGKLEANRELVEWMREYNAAAKDRPKLRFYGFDSPTEMMYSDSPRRLLEVAVNYFDGIDVASGQAHRERIATLLGDDARWENPQANMDPTQSVGLSAEAAALRVAAEDLIGELRMRRPELIACSDYDRYFEAVHHAESARQLLNYHAVIAKTFEKRLAEALGIRDLMMADNLAYMVVREQRRHSTNSSQGGRVLAFAHNSHLKLGQARWQLGPQLLEWWPAGAQMRSRLGERYAMIGAGVGTSEENGIGSPEAGTIEARLTAAPGPGRFVPTHLGRGLPAREIAALTTRTWSVKNPSYFPLTPESVKEFDWFVVLDSVTYSRGGPVLA